METIDTVRIISRAARNVSVSGACKCLPKLLTISVIAASLARPALSQFAAPLVPAAGDGSIPKPEIAGDSLPSPAVLSGTAETTPLSGTNLSHTVNRGRTNVYIYSYDSRGTDDLMSGMRLSLTLRPATLMSTQVSKIGNILGVNLNSGQAVIKVTATAHQLELVQSVLSPSANDATLALARMTKNRTKQLDKAPTPEQWAQLRKAGDESVHINGGVLPTARVCARYFVFAAVAFSTVLLIFAASSIVFGQAHGGPRVIAACGGLVLLLMGYSIYKVAVINLFNTKGTIKQHVDIIRHFSNEGQLAVGNK